MKTLLFTIFFLSVLLSCKSEDRLPAGIIIFAKTIVHNERESSGLSLCVEKKENSNESCVYYLNGKRYIKRLRYLFYNGVLREVRTFHPEGPLSYNLDALNSDPELKNLYKTKNQSVRILSGKVIIDNGDTVRNYSIDSKNKLILVDKSKFKKTDLSEMQCVIYEFR